MRNCTAYPTEEKDCCTIPQWIEWSPWTACTGCGGERTRFRTCNPGTCNITTGSTISIDNDFSVTCNGEPEEEQSEPCEEAYEAILITYLNKAMIFTPNNLSWVDLPGIPGEPRERFTLAENIICGGSWPETSRSCLELTDSCDSGWWNYSSELVKRRVDSVSWKVPEGVIVIGGYFSPDTTELATPTDSNLDFAVDYIIEACAINVGKHVIITGGLKHMKRVIEYDEAGKITPLPYLSPPGRRLHACSSYKDNSGDTVLLVTGGYTGTENTKTTEILLPKAPKWVFVGELPLSSVVGLSATNVDNIIYLIGGETDIYTFNNISRGWEYFFPMIHKEDCKIEISTVNCTFAESLANSCGAITPAPTPTPSAQGNAVLLYSGQYADGYEYYKVPVRHGERLVEGKVAETCEAVGLQAVCYGPVGCQFTDTSKCMVTPWSQCNGWENMYPLTKYLCGLGMNDAIKCPQLQGLFMYMKDWRGLGECGIVGGKFCAQGRDYVAGPGKEYYAYCAKNMNMIEI